MGKRCTARLWVVMVVVVAALPVGGCSVRVTPPTAPADPVRVVLVDFGDTSRLVLPRGDGRWVEYGFGEWKWYALNRESLVRGPAALLWPTRSTLCRYEYPDPSGDDPPWTGGERDYAIDVERDSLEALVARLDASFEAGRGKLVHNTRRGMDFVPLDGSGYWYFHNSTTVVASWLRELGCQTRGFSLMSNYRLEAPPEGEK